MKKKNAGVCVCVCYLLNYPTPHSTKREKRKKPETRRKGRGDTAEEPKKSYPSPRGRPSSFNAATAHFTTP